MNYIYLDTNIFIYLSKKNSPYFLSAIKLIKWLKKNKFFVSTSTETIQEIIHFSQNIKQVLYGIRTSKKALEIVDEIFPVDREIINIYFDLVSKHKNIKSRDSLHIAVCISNKIKTIITYDKDFKKFKEISSFTPGEFLKKHRV